MQWMLKQFYSPGLFDFFGWIHNHHLIGHLRTSHVMCDQQRDIPVVS